AAGESSAHGQPSPENHFIPTPNDGGETIGSRGVVRSDRFPGIGLRIVKRAIGKIVAWRIGTPTPYDHLCPGPKCGMRKPPRGCVVGGHCAPGIRHRVIAETIIVSFEQVTLKTAPNDHLRSSPNRRVQCTCACRGIRRNTAPRVGIWIVTATDL